jgi:hypothetical protein
MACCIVMAKGKMMFDKKPERSEFTLENLNRAEKRHYRKMLIKNKKFKELKEFNDYYK